MYSFRKIAVDRQTLVAREIKKMDSSTKENLVKLLLRVISMKFSSLPLGLEVGTYFRLSASIFLKHSFLRVVSLTQENGGELNTILPGHAWTIAGGWHPLEKAKELSENQLEGHLTLGSLRKTTGGVWGSKLLRNSFESALVPRKMGE